MTTRHLRKNPFFLICLLILLIGILLISGLAFSADDHNGQVLQSTDQVEDVSAPIEDQIVIVYNEPKDNNFSELSLTKNEISEATSVSDSVDIVTPTDGQDPDDLIADLKNQENVQTVCRNIELTTDTLDDLPNDPSTESYPAYYLNSQIDETWDITNPEAEEVVVAVLDTGLNPQSEDFAGRCYPVTDFLTPNDPQTDLDGHGTNVASVIAAVTNNETGLAGSSGLSNVKILPYRVGGSSASKGDIELSSVVSAIQDIVNNHPEVQVVNMSFGATLTDADINGKYKSTVDSLQTCVNQLFEKGILTIAAAGNNASCYFNYPSSCDHVVSVASVKTDGTHSSFSNYNTLVDIAATGESVPVANKDGSYKTGRGTSFSAPIVSGACAFLLSTTGKTPDEIMNAIYETADSRTYGEKNVYTGYGILQLKDAFEVLAGESDFLVNIENSTHCSVGDCIQISAVSEGDLTYSFTVNDQLIAEGCNQISYKILKQGEQTIKVTATMACGAQHTQIFSVDADGSDLLIGDINCDDILNITDVRMAKQAAMKMLDDDLSEESLLRSDLDGNGKITINEVRKIKRIVLKEIILN